VGAVLVNYGKTFFTGGTVLSLGWLFDLAPSFIAHTSAFAALRDNLSAIPLAPYWLFVLGGMFVAVTLLLPLGIVGTLQRWTPGLGKRSTNGDGEPVVSASQPRPAE
jgi:ABC-type branched-subunit amino acid transport system permease subunit